MADPISVSHSDIAAFLRCRRRWYWSYVQDYTPTEKRTGPLALGTRVHKALEAYYRDFGTDPVKVHDDLAAVDLDWLKANGKPWEVEDLYEDMIVGRKCVHSHQEWLASSGADDGYEVVSVEEKYETLALDGAVKIICKLDLVFRDIETGFLWVNDLKTDGSWSGGTRDNLERSWQHHIYGMVLSDAHPDETVGGSFYTVIKKMKRPERSSKPPVERWQVPGTQRALKFKRAQLDVLLRDMLTLMERSAAEAYPTPDTSCRWCDYKAPCLLADEIPEAADEYLDRHYRRGARHARYDTLYDNPDS